MNNDERLKLKTSGFLLASIIKRQSSPAQIIHFNPFQLFGACAKWSIIIWTNTCINSFWFDWHVGLYYNTMYTLSSNLSNIS